MRRYDRPEDEWVEVPFPAVVDEEDMGPGPGGQEAASDPFGPQHHDILSPPAPGQVRRVRVPDGLPGQHKPEDSRREGQVVQLQAEDTPPLLQVLRDGE